MVKLSGTLAYLLAILTLSSGMVVLMFGLSSIHGSMDDLHATIAAQEKAIREAASANQKLSAKLLHAEEVAASLAKDLGKQQDSLASHDNLIQASRDDYAQQIKQLSDKLDSLTAESGAAKKEQKLHDDDVQRTLNHDHETLHDTADKVTELEQSVEKISSQLEEAHGETQRLDKAQHALDAAVANLSSSVAGSLRGLSSGTPSAGALAGGPASPLASSAAAPPSSAP
eukprot:CAMPEP_0115483520 /NCGR_PEP_ID=MMETSP0271-20121206/58898_1 /TAXON_ID=71861 /ORGANISM="Scrippsiella trochoidea, Strain CCMP3099" /LENGTH=227 /DNA_ID=CAMNT_0002911373 /DNA_START=1 /DNA_END=681 /DNA_ORIENTATION=+